MMKVRDLRRSRRFPKMKTTMKALVKQEAKPGLSLEEVPVPKIGIHDVQIRAEPAAIFDPFGNAGHTALSFDVLGEDVLITGAGPIGIMAAAVVKHAGARSAVVTDVNEYRLELARRMGATVAWNVGQGNLRQVQEQLGMVEGFDVGLEMSGNPSAFRDMIDKDRKSVV